MMERAWFNVVLIVIIMLQTCRSQDVTYYLDEEKPNGTYIGNVGQDSNLFSALSDSQASLIFSFLSTGQQHAQYFRINEKTSELYTNIKLDREQICEFMEVCLLNLQVAANSQFGSFFRILKVNIFLTDLNDHPPIFQQPSLTLPISESVLVGTSFAIEGARDRDTSAEYSLKSYEIEASESLEQIGIPFTVKFVKHLDGSSTVRLFVSEPLDREKTDSYDLEIVAKDGGTPPRVGRLALYIKVMDENDNPPLFSSDNYKVNITETFPINETVFNLNAVDPDFEDNGRVGYRFSPHQSAENFKYFAINEETGEIILKDRIVYSPGKQFNLIVEAYDHAADGNRLTSQTLVIVQVENEGNTPPRIRISKMFGANVSERANIGTVIAFVRVEDHDAGRQGMVGCIIESLSFELKLMDLNQYRVIVASSLDYERNKTQNVTVHCQDDGVPPLQTSESFIVNILDANDHKPMFGRSYYTANIRENFEIGRVITTVNASDLDSENNSRVYFTVPSDLRDIFYFDNSTTPINTAHLILKKPLDRESRPSYLFTIYAIDMGSPAKTGTATVSLYITDVNDKKPTFTNTPFYFTVLEDLPANVLVDNLTATDNDLGINAQITFRIHPEDSRSVPFTVTKKGLVKTTSALDRESKSHYEFRVIAMDKGSPPLSSTGTIVITVNDINDNSPIFEFPKYDNSSVNVLFTTVPWQIIANVKAFDLDQIGHGNSQLKYSINDRNDTQLFQINPKSGEVQLIQQLDASYLGQTYRLDILASDFGQPLQRSTLSPLYIKIIASNVTEPESISDALGGKNFIIIVIIGIVTIVLSLGILITICLIGKVDRQRKRDQRNKTVELNLDADAKPFDGSITVFSLPSEDSLINDRRKKEVSFSLEDDVFSDDDLLQKNCGDRKNNHYRPACTLSYLAPSNNKIEDNHSETSGDTGTSDSGRGGSDDEIHNSITRSPPPIDQIIDVNTQIQPLSHQEIIPFSFKKGLSLLRERDSLRDGHTFSRGDIELSNLPSKHNRRTSDISDDNSHRHFNRTVLNKQSSASSNGHVIKLEGIASDDMAKDYLV